jgi:2-amino-4-hydroxy-6-hydroxymethyldihydropteridine diphosphokinase
MSAVRAYVGLGSNLNGPERQVRSALEALTELPHTQRLAASSLYVTAPMGPAGQPDYVNAVAVLETTLEPLALLDALMHIEAVHGRTRDGERWGPRTLDLDLLLYGDRVIDHPRLTVPHPGLALRAFVLLPLAEVAPDRVLPDGRAVAALADACDRRGVRRLSGTA